MLAKKVLDKENLMQYGAYNFNNNNDSIPLIFDTEATESQNYSTVGILYYKV